MTNLKTNLLTYVLYYLVERKTVDEVIGSVYEVTRAAQSQVTGCAALMDLFPVQGPTFWIRQLPDADQILNKRLLPFV